MILDLLDSPKQKEDLIEESGLPFDKFLSSLSVLEGRGLIKDNFGEIVKVGDC